MFSAPDNSDARVICQGRWQDSKNDSDVKFWVVEQDDSVSGHYEFDEDALCVGAEIDEEMILQTYNSAFSVIENIVALTKRFHNNNLPLTDGKWALAQIVLNERLPVTSGKIQIENYQNIKNRFSRNRIVLDGKLVGEIRFIVA